MRKCNVISFKVTDDEIKEISHACAASGKTLSTFVREKIMEAIRNGKKDRN